MFFPWEEHIIRKWQIMACCYTEFQQRWLALLYVVALLIWLIIIIHFCLYSEPAWWILLLPFVIFALGLANISEITEEVEDAMFTSGSLSVGLILALPLFAWLSDKYDGDRRRFMVVLVLALSFSLLTMIDIWIPQCWVCFYRHLRSALQVMGITLLIFALVNYYLHRDYRP